MLNIAILYGRLVEAPVLSSKENGSDTNIWCPFRLAVGRDRKKEGEADADFFHVSSLDGLLLIWPAGA